MGFFKKLTGQEPLMKTILGTFNFMTTNLDSKLEDLKISDISVVAQVQIIHHTVSENSFRVEIKTLEKSTILDGMEFPEIKGDITSYKLTDFNGTGQYLLKFSTNDLRIHSFSKNSILRYVNLNLNELQNRKEKLKEYKSRYTSKPVSNIFTRTDSKKLIQIEEEFIKWLKNKPMFWNVYGKIYDILPRYRVFKFEEDWYKKFIAKYGENIISYILKGHYEKTNHIPDEEIDTFLHLQSKLNQANLLRGSLGESGESIYDFVVRITEIEINEQFDSHIISNKDLIEFSIKFDKINDNDFDLIYEIEERNEDDGLIAYEINQSLEDVINEHYENKSLTLSNLKESFVSELQKAKISISEFKDTEAKEKFLSLLELKEEFIKNFK